MTTENCGRDRKLFRGFMHRGVRYKRCRRTIGRSFERINPVFNGIISRCNVRGTFNKFPDFFVQAFKIVVDSWKFSILLLYILWPIMISGSNEQLQHSSNRVSGISTRTMHQFTTPSLSQTIWPRWASRQFLSLPKVQTLLPVTFAYSLSSEAVIMRQLRRWKWLWRRSLTRSHKRTSMGPSRSCWDGTTRALQLKEITSKGTRVSCVYYQ